VKKVVNPAGKGSADPVSEGVDARQAGVSTIGIARTYDRESAEHGRSNQFEQYF
jgi:hypothetical protein